MTLSDPSQALCGSADCGDDSMLFIRPRTDMKFMTRSPQAVAFVLAGSDHGAFLRCRWRFTVALRPLRAFGLRALSFRLGRACRRGGCEHRHRHGLVAFPDHVLVLHFRRPC